MSVNKPAKEATSAERSGSWRTIYDSNTRILKTQLAGVVDSDTLHAMAESVSAQADAVNPIGILADFSATTVELRLDEIFELPARAPEFGVSAEFPIAIVFDSRYREAASFAEDVFSNRGYVYKAFRNRGSAAAWLTDMLETDAASMRRRY